MHVFFIERRITSNRPIAITFKHATRASMHLRNHAGVVVGFHRKFIVRPLLRQGYTWNNYRRCWLGYVTNFNSNIHPAGDVGDTLFKYFEQGIAKLKKQEFDIPVNIFYSAG